MKKCRYLLCAFLLCAILPCLPVPASASDYYADYYDISQDVVINKTQVVPGEVFQINVDVHVVCIQDMPYDILGCEFDAGISAVNSASGEYAIQKYFTYTVSPIPVLKDETAEEVFKLDESFPDTASPGSYDLVVEITGACVQYQSYAVQQGDFTPVSMTIGSITLLAASETTAAEAIPEAPTISLPPSHPTISTSQAVTETAETTTTTEPPLTFSLSTDIPSAAQTIAAE